MSQDQHPQQDSKLFPVFLKLAGRRVLLVGAGPVAAGKLRSLLEAGASVTVVAPEVHDEIARSGAALVRREFVAADLDDVFFAVAAATPEVNRQVRSAGEARRVFVNAVDDPEAASAYTGGVVRRGGVTIAISTEGRAPALAGLLREALAALLPEDLESWVAEAQALRARQRATGISMGQRRPQLLEALNTLYQAKGSAA